MKKKVYAVKAGRTTGIFDTWDECRRQVTGYKGALFKSFESRAEAEEYLAGGSSTKADADLTAYVDGSYNIRTKTFAYGVVIIDRDGTEKTFNGAFNNAAGSMRNVAGEIAASRFAIEYAVENGYKSIVIYHDYQGIASWATGEWKRNLAATEEYYEYCQSVKDKIDVSFVKVKGHSGDKYNDIADALAKEAANVK